MEVREDELGINNGDVVRRVDLTVNVDHVLIGEGSHHLADGVSFTDVGEEGVAHAFTLGSAFDNAGDVHEGHGGREDALGAEDFREAVQAGIGELNEADIRLNGGKRVVRRQDVGTGQGIKQSGLAHVGQADDSKCKTHGANPNAPRIF